MNMNYLAVRALHHYGNTDGPYQSQALKLYQQLRFELRSLSCIYRENSIVAYLSLPLKKAARLEQ